MFQVKIIADSVSRATGFPHRLITFQLTYPRAIHAELLTHRQLSRNAMSSRAIPVARMIKQVREEPFVPFYWGANQPGMQAGAELEGEARETAIGHWLIAAENAANSAERLMEMGVHKQNANRLLEPFQWMTSIVTGTEWENFFALRDHDAAEPHFHRLAGMMRGARDLSDPVELLPGEWHLPYVRPEERSLSIETLVKVSAARCARVSFLNHDGTDPSISKDIELCHKLVGSRPMHASPVEHQATPDNFNPMEGWDNEGLHGNFKGWVQHRKILEVGGDPLALTEALIHYRPVPAKGGLRRRSALSIGG